MGDWKVKKLEKEVMTAISFHKERILEAWIAQTGLMPSECELVEQRFPDEWRYFVRRREGDSLIEKSQYQTIKALEAENQRLRQALESIATYNNGVLDGIKLWSVIEIARQALADINST